MGSALELWDRTWAFLVSMFNLYDIFFSPFRDRFCSYTFFLISSMFPLLSACQHHLFTFSSCFCFVLHNTTQLCSCCLCFIWKRYLRSHLLGNLGSVKGVFIQGIVLGLRLGRQGYSNKERRHLHESVWLRMDGLVSLRNWACAVVHLLRTTYTG